ncbi:MAG: DUF1127 domain-containing protein [Pseudomonadota bacterium]
MIEQATVRSIAMTRQALRRAITRLLRAAFQMIDRARQRRVLADLDDRLLRDIGRTRDEAWREASKPAWRR